MTSDRLTSDAMTHRRADPVADLTFDEALAELAADGRRARGRRPAARGHDRPATSGASLLERTARRCSPTRELRMRQLVERAGGGLDVVALKDEPEARD